MHPGLWVLLAVVVGVGIFVWVLARGGFWRLRKSRKTLNDAEGVFRELHHQALRDANQMVVENPDDMEIRRYALDLREKAKKSLNEWDEIEQAGQEKDRRVAEKFQKAASWGLVLLVAVIALKAFAFS